MSKPAAVYRPCDATGTLLYIGMSQRVGGRMADHENNSPWWPEVRSVTFETWPTLAAARAEHPVHNKTRFRTQWPARARQPGVRAPAP
jgi:hypothetical protein